MAILGSNTEYSNTLGVSIGSTANVPPPAISLQRSTILEGESAVVQWSGSGANMIVVEVSSSPTFATLLKSLKQQTSYGSLTIDGLTAGNYWIRAKWWLVADATGRVMG